MNPHRRRLSPGRVRLLVLAFCTLSPAALFARPGYAQLTELLPGIWNARYPIAAESFIPNPEKLGVLTAVHGGRRVYYYHYHAILPRPRRSGEKVEIVGRRKIELWVRYRPGLKEPYDISFARRDRLPGTGRRWLR